MRVPGVQLGAAVVVLGAALPHAKVRRAVRALHIEDEVLNKTHLVRREYYLKTNQPTRR